MRKTFASELKRLEEALGDVRDRQAFAARLTRELAEIFVALDKIQGRQDLLADIMAAGSLTEDAPEIVQNDDLPTEMTIQADHRLDPAAGFYWLEHNSTGEAFRWTGPDTTFEFELVISRAKPLLVRVSLVATIDERNIDEARCMVDGREIECTIVKGAAVGSFDIECVAPPRSRGGATSFKVYTPYVQPASGDDRAIGVAFASLAATQTEDFRLLPNLATAEEPPVAKAAVQETVAASDASAGGKGRGPRNRFRNTG